MTVGAIYDRAEPESLRVHGVGYLHGHTVVGTNPSLVAAMAAGNAVLAHDNAYNQWVARGAALYFTSAEEVSLQLGTMLLSPECIQRLRLARTRRHQDEFTREHVAAQYEQVLLRFFPSAGDAAAGSSHARRRVSS